MNSDADLVPPLGATAFAPVGGRIRSRDRDFRVIELPLYEPSGEGEHLYVEVTREGRTTREVQTTIARAVGVQPAAVGYAGLKDKSAACTQRFSVATKMAEADVAKRIADSDDALEVVILGRHGNKLRRGHLLGNRFRIVVREPRGDDARERAEGIVRGLAAAGVPNWFGLQRFGKDRENVVRARQVLAGRRPPSRWLGDLWLSAWQSALFNRWLTARLADVATLSVGDVVKKTDSGALFTVEDAVVEQRRLEAGEIVVTGPLYGAKLRFAEGVPGEVERRLLEDEEVTAADLGRVRLSGSRRAALVRPGDAAVHEDGEDLVVEFSLPKGSYATTVLREVMGEAELV